MTEMNVSQESELPPLPIKHDWYQTDSTVVITVLVKNVKEEELKFSFTETTVNLDIHKSGFQHVSQCFNLSHKIVPGQSSCKLTTSKIEIKLKKAEDIRWNKLEGALQEEIFQTIPQSSSSSANPLVYPSSKKGIDWNKIESQIKKEEENEKPAGEEALNALFHDIYSKASDDVKKAMNKSFMESGGTVLSTNWDEVSKKTVDVKPPEGVEYKLWNR